MAKPFSAKFVYALAEIITGGSASSSKPSIGIYRTGPRIEKFFRGLGYEVILGGSSRHPFTEDLLMEIYDYDTRKTE